MEAIVVGFLISSLLLTLGALGGYIVGVQHTKDRFMQRGG